MYKISMIFNDITASNIQKSICTLIVPVNKEGHH